MDSAVLLAIAIMEIMRLTAGVVGKNASQTERRTALSAWVSPNTPALLSPINWLDSKDSAEVGNGRDDKIRPLCPQALLWIVAGRH